MFALTKVIWQGPFASPSRLERLRETGITHILNVSDAPNVLCVNDGPFVDVRWVPVVDLERVPRDVAIAGIDTLHAMVTTPDSAVYVHCVAGYNRSPTIVWLYLVACGVDAEGAKEFIGHRSMDAVPGHSRLVDADLINAVKSHGRQYFPHSRPDALIPA
jgi:hypothetical protein